MSKLWTTSEIEYLRKCWGRSTLPYIANKLNRSKYAILVMANRLKLGAITKAGECMTATQAGKMLGIDHHSIIYWIKHFDLRAIHKIMSFKMRYWMINHSDLLEWLEVHQDKFDSRKIEAYALGIEPLWLRKKRRSDILFPNRHKKWTSLEEQQIMLNSDMHYRKIAHMMGRSYNAIRVKIWKLRCNNV